MTMLNLEAKAHGSRVLTDWAASRDGFAKRMGRDAVRNDVTDSSGVISSSDPRVLDLFGVGGSAAGVAVTAESAMRVSAVFACVRIIAGAIASMPIHVYKRTAEGRERVDDAPLWWLLNEQPTPRYSAASHWEQVGAQEQLRGDAFTFIGRNAMGTIKELVPMPWSAVRVQREQSAGVDRLKYYLQDGLRTWGADQDDMLHFPGFGFNGLRGMSVIQYAARNAAGTAMAMDEYSGRFFAGGAHPSIVLQTDKSMKESTITALQLAFAQKYSGVDNMHKLPLVLTEGLKAEELSINAEDSQLLDSRKFQVVDIARAFGVPPHLIGETSASTSWGAGIEAMGRAFVTFSLQSHLMRIEQELNRKLFRTAANFVEFNRDSLLEGDSKGQAQFFRAALGGPGTGPGWMKVDDVRKLKNLPPLGGRCAEVYFPPDKGTSSPAPTEPKEEDDEEASAAAA